MNWMNRPKRGARSTPSGSRRTNAGGKWQPLHHFTESISGEIRTQGFNTDSDGIARSLREDLGLKLAGLKVLLVGTGGAGQVAALRLAMEGVAELFVTDYVIAKAEAVAAEIRKRYPRVKVTVGFPERRNGFAAERHAHRLEGGRSVAGG